MWVVNAESDPAGNAPVPSGMAASLLSGHASSQTEICRKDLSNTDWGHGVLTGINRGAKSVAGVFPQPYNQPLNHCATMPPSHAAKEVRHAESD
jgi:hypothetical protein